MEFLTKNLILLKISSFFEFSLVGLVHCLNQGLLEFSKKNYHHYLYYSQSSDIHVVSCAIGPFVFNKLQNDWFDLDHLFCGNSTGMGFGCQNQKRMSQNNLDVKLSFFLVASTILIRKICTSCFVIASFITRKRSNV